MVKCNSVDKIDDVLWLTFVSEIARPMMGLRLCFRVHWPVGTLWIDPSHVIVHRVQRLYTVSLKSLA